MQVPFSQICIYVHIRKLEKPLINYFLLQPWILTFEKSPTLFISLISPCLTSQLAKICFIFQDLHMVELEDFKYGGTNITALRLVDPAEEKVITDKSWDKCWPVSNSIIKAFSTTVNTFKRLMIMISKNILFRFRLLWGSGYKEKHGIADRFLSLGKQSR